MELGRWSAQKITRITKRYRDLKKFMADVLDGESGLLDAPEESNGAKPIKAFEPDNGILNLESLPVFLNTGKTRDQAVGRFQSLHPYFEAGFLLTDEDDGGSATSLKLKSMFIFGKVFEPQKDNRPQLRLSLPECEVGHVYRGRSMQVLCEFRLESVSRLAESSTFLFSLRNGVKVLLLCSRPGPWQALAIENAFHVLSQIERSAEKTRRKSDPAAKSGEKSFSNTR